MIAQQPVRFAGLSADRAVAGSRGAGRGAILQRLGERIRDGDIVLDVIADGIPDDVLEGFDAVGQLTHGAQFGGDIAGRIACRRKVGRQAVKRRDGVQRGRVVDARRTQRAGLVEVGQIDHDRVAPGGLGRLCQRQRVLHAGGVACRAGIVGGEVILNGIVRREGAPGSGIAGGSARQVYVDVIFLFVAEQRVGRVQDHDAGGLRLAQAHRVGQAGAGIHGGGIVVDEDEVDVHVLLHRLEVFQRIGNGVAVQLRLLPDLVPFGIVFAAGNEVGKRRKLLLRRRKLDVRQLDLLIDSRALDQIPVHVGLFLGEVGRGLVDLVHDIGIALVPDRVVDGTAFGDGVDLCGAVTGAGIGEGIGHAVGGHAATGDQGGIHGRVGHEYFNGSAVFQRDGQQLLRLKGRKRPEAPVLPYAFDKLLIFVILIELRTAFKN